MGKAETVGMQHTATLYVIAIKFSINNLIFSNENEIHFFFLMNYVMTAFFCIVIFNILLVLCC